MKHKLEVIAETADWIAINKPSGLLSIPDRTQSEPSLKDLLAEKYGKIWVVHRLDQPTSGLILFAKNENTHQYLSRQFEARKVEKFYIGLVIGSPLEKTGTINAGIMEHPVKKGTYLINAKGKESLTTYEVLGHYGRYTRMRFQIHTGRTHQIRVHLKNIGHPILCDDIYGDGSPLLLSSVKGKKFKLSKTTEEERPILQRLALHAHTLEFTDTDGKLIQLEAELSKDLQATFKQLEKWY